MQHGSANAQNASSNPPLIQRNVTVPVGEQRNITANDAETVKKYGRNRISNTKYTPITFLPHDDTQLGLLTSSLRVEHMQMNL